ncbi:MAG: rhomboid family intramembrane serine protease [Candidatus Planktophila sp.]
MKAYRSATLSLITIICAFFLWQKINPLLINNFFLPPLAGLENSGQWYRLFTVALMHDQTSDLPYHLAFNMLALHSLGTQVESILGTKKFVTIFFLSLLAGSFTSAYFLPVNGYSIGVSGAVFGLFGAILVIGKRYGADMKSTLITVGLNLAIGFTIPGIDWRAHLGGLIGGALAAKLLVHK